MTYTGYSGAENGYVGIADSWKAGDVTDPNAIVTPTQMLMAEVDGLDASFAQIERLVLGGGRDADRGHRTGKAKAGGQVQFALYPNNGISLLVDAIGDDAYTTAATADTTVSITTANGESTLVLTTGGAAYAPPKLVTVGTGSSQEIVPVISYNSGTKTLVLPALENTHASSGTGVTLVAQHLTTPYSTASGYGNLLRRLSIEDNVGGKYSYAYPNTMVGMWELKASASKFDVTADLVCSGKRSKVVSPTAYNDSDATLNDLGFEFTDGYFVIPTDPGDTGTATLQRTGDVMDWDVKINNNMREIPCFDGTSFYKYFPGQRTVEVTFGMLNQSSRPVGYEDFVSQNKDAQWFGFARLNIGTPTTPVWQAICFYAPNLRYLTSKEKKGIQDVIGEDITAKARKANGLEKLYVSFVNASTAAI